ncbi:MAG: M28 family peptidase [Gemmatales bacterium]|nr:M28 family peptidase [Gemmatales bacterium]
MTSTSQHRHIRLAGLGILVVAIAAVGIWLTSSGRPVATPGPEDDRAKPGDSIAAPLARRLLEASFVMTGRFFQAERALQYLREICALGPRVSGSPGMKKQQELLRKHFERYGAMVEFQRFEARQRSRKEAVEMVNVLARWHPERPRRLLLCTHYDTRPIADQEPDERLWTKPFLGANDGASGVALMMELAQTLPRLPVQVGVDFVCFDGEEYVFDPRPSDWGGDRYFFGSEHFAQHYAKQRRQTPHGPVYVEAVLVDMIAGKNPRFYIEQYSLAQAGPLVEKIWSYAALLDCRAFVPQAKHAVLDDHLELLKVGIPAVDIIDFDYPHWHRLSDTPENCSADGLDQVGRVVLLWLMRAR